MPGYYTDGPISTDPGSILDYEASDIEAFFSAADNLESNPAAYIGRGARYLTENLDALTGGEKFVSQADADAEVKSAGLDIKIEPGGITRYELNAKMWLKQREIRRNVIAARSQGWGGAAAGFAGGFLAQSVDPINAASAFIPFVPEARYASMLARQGGSFAGRAGVRIGVGAVEGAAGAAVVEPINLLGARYEQADYGIEDSFLNIAFGTLLGGGLHAVGGSWHDARVSRALRSLDDGLQILAVRDVAGAAPEEVKLQALHEAVRSLEDDMPVRVEHVFTEDAKQRAAAGEEVHPDWEVDERDGKGTFVERLVSTGNTIRPVDPVKLGAREITTQQIEGRDVTFAVDNNGNVIVYMKAKDQAYFEHGLTERPVDDPARSDFENADLKRAYPKDENELRMVGTIRRRIDADGTPTSEVKNSAVAPYLEGRGIEDTMRAIAESEGVDVRSGKETRRDRGAKPDAERLPDQEAADLDEFAMDAMETASRAADQQLTKIEAAGDRTPEDVAADREVADAHIASMRERGLVDEEMEAMLEAADEEAKRMEGEAKAYEAAGVCDTEDTEL
jgi:hypothetical protein